MEGGSIDEVREEPPEDDLDNLLMVKVMNFNWRRFEVQLVSYLSRKASSLHKLWVPLAIDSTAVLIHRVKKYPQSSPSLLPQSPTGPISYSSPSSAPAGPLRSA